MITSAGSMNKLRQDSHSGLFAESKSSLQQRASKLSDEVSYANLIKQNSSNNREGASERGQIVSLD